MFCLFVGEVSSTHDTYMHWNLSLQYWFFSFFFIYIRNTEPKNMKYVYIHTFCHENNHINKNVNLENNFILVVAVVVYRQRNNPHTNTHTHLLSAFQILILYSPTCFFLRVPQSMCIYDFYISEVVAFFFSESHCAFHSTCLHLVWYAFRHAKCSPSIHRSSNRIPAIHSHFVICMQLCTQVNGYVFLVGAFVEHTFCTHTHMCHAKTSISFVGKTMFYHWCKWKSSHKWKLTQWITLTTNNQNKLWQHGLSSA